MESSVGKLLVLPFLLLTKRCSWGVISYADSLDCVGVLGKNTDCVQKVFRKSDQNYEIHC